MCLVDGKQGLASLSSLVLMSGFEIVSGLNWTWKVVREGKEKSSYYEAFVKYVFSSFVIILSLLSAQLSLSRLLTLTRHLIFRF